MHVCSVWEHHKDALQTRSEEFWLQCDTPPVFDAMQFASDELLCLRKTNFASHWTQLASMPALHALWSDRSQDTKQPRTGLNMSKKSSDQLQKTKLEPYKVLLSQLQASKELHLNLTPAESDRCQQIEHRVSKWTCFPSLLHCTAFANGNGSGND